VQPDRNADRPAGPEPGDRPGTAERRSIPAGLRTIDVELHVPDRARHGSGPWPGVLLLHEMFGLNSNVRADARALARAGYLVLTPDLYSSQGLRRYCIKMLFTAEALANRGTGEAVREVADCLDYLKAEPRCNGKLGMIGMCLTGGFVLQMARRDDLAAPVVFHHALGARGPGLPAAEAAEIKHTVLGHFGELDKLLCPRSRVDQLQAELGARLEAHFYPEVGHGIRSTFRYTPQAEEAWQRTLDFFAAQLG
jgi:carboxymethylenebutenolidase